MPIVDVLDVSVSSAALARCVGRPEAIFARPHHADRVSQHMNSIYRQLFWAFLLIGWVLGGCAAKQTKPADRSAGPAKQAASSAKQREKVHITVYNQNFGLVREIRKLDLGEGKISLEYRDVSA